MRDRYFKDRIGYDWKANEAGLFWREKGRAEWCPSMHTSVDNMVRAEGAFECDISGNPLPAPTTPETREPDDDTSSSEGGGHKPEQAPAPGSLEWWRWEFAGRAMEGFCATERPIAFNVVIEGSVVLADGLIAELLKNGAK